MVEEITDLQIVVGAGQIGTAIAEVLKDAHPVILLDVKGHSAITTDVLHICFPWTDKFHEQVKKYQEIYDPLATIIHSTVPVGTSRKLGAVHSPVTGRHPHLEESIRTFTKFFGGPGAYYAQKIFEMCGVKTFAVLDQETTEAGKLWQTLQFGWQVALEKEAYDWMTKHGADYRVAYNMMNKAYNEGYADLGTSFNLPTVNHMDGPIGGHCIISNTELTDSDVATLLRMVNQRWENKDAV